MFNLFSQENMYDEAATQEDMTGERAAAEAKWQERRQKFEEERKKEMEPRPFTGETRPEYKNGSIVKSGEQYGYLRGVGTPEVQFHPLKLVALVIHAQHGYLQLPLIAHIAHKGNAQPRTLHDAQIGGRITRKYFSSHVCGF